MARNKQKKKSESVAGSRAFPPEGRAGRTNGTSSAAGVEGLEGASGEAMRRRGRKTASQASHVKYQKRYDYLLTSETVSGHEVRLSGSPSPSKFTHDFTSTIAHGSNTASEKFRTKSSSRLRSYSHVGFIYKDIETRREFDHAQGGHSSGVDATTEVVLPASDGRAEVVLDRRASQPSLMTSSPIHESGSTWGLGYVQEEFPGLDMETTVEEKLGQEGPGYAIEASSGWEPVGYATEERSGEELVECANERMPVEEYAGDAFQAVSQAPQEVGDRCREAINVSLSDCVTDVVRKKPNRKSRGNDGYLSIGGVKIFTTDMSAFSSGENEGSRIGEVRSSDEEDEEDGLEDWLSEFRSGKNRSRQSRKGRTAKHNFDPYRERPTALHSSEGDESSQHSDSDIDDELMEDYLANCEGLVVDLDDPVWVKNKTNSLRQVRIEDMLLQNMESESSETLSEEDLDKEEDDASDSFGDQEETERCYKVTAGDFGRRVTLIRPKEKSHALADKIIFGYDSDASCSDEGDRQEELTCSDDEARMQGLELDGQARMRVLELNDDTEEVVGLDGSLQNDKQQKLLIRQPFVLSEEFDSHEMRDGMASTSANCDQDFRDKEASPTQAWPVSRGGRKLKKGKSVPGQKKQERKETIATKRRKRALQRDFDLCAVNKMLEDMVIKKKDIIAFEPMKQQDRAQVHRIASIYGLKSGSQGSTKKRFVVVSLTRHTSMPSGEDKVRLLKLLGQSAKTSTRPEMTQRALTGEERRMFAKTKRAALQALHDLQAPSNVMRRQGSYKPSQGKTPGTSNGHFQHTSRGSQQSSSSIKRNSVKTNSRRAVVYANNPVSFTATGMMVESSSRPMQSSSSVPSVPAMHETVSSMRVVAHSTVTNGDFATFEAHTKGFGSRMMAKMGYREGLGLGRDKQGISEPVEVIKRPKSLGLGAHM